MCIVHEGGGGAPTVIAIVCLSLNLIQKMRRPLINSTILKLITDLYPKANIRLTLRDFLFGFLHVLGVEPRALNVTGKYSAPEL